jgi:hypothetical protein
MRREFEEKGVLDGGGGVGCSVTSRDRGRPCEGCEVLRVGYGWPVVDVVGVVEGVKERPASFDQANPADDDDDGLGVLEGRSRSKDNPFWGSQARPPFPVGAPNLCISSSYMRSCSA